MILTKVYYLLALCSPKEGKEMWIVSHVPEISSISGLWALTAVLKESVLTCPQTSWHRSMIARLPLLCSHCWRMQMLSGLWSAPRLPRRNNEIAVTELERGGCNKKTFHMSIRVKNRAFFPYHRRHRRHLLLRPPPLQGMGEDEPHRTNA